MEWFLKTFGKNTLSVFDGAVLASCGSMFSTGHWIAGIATLLVGAIIGSDLNYYAGRRGL